MIYKPFGNTGIDISALGFGCMRLPMTTKGGESVVDDTLAIPLLQKAVEMGINFFDTHWFYCNYDSKRAVGDAVRLIRDKVYISSKVPPHLIDKPEDFTDYFYKTLEAMELEYLDFLHISAMSYPIWKDMVLGYKLIDRAEKLKAKGLIHHLSFSFHSDTDKMSELIDTGAFSSIMGQYNIVDRENEEIFAYAQSKGVGTIVMSPLMGGVLTDGGNTFLAKMESGASSAAEMALRFIWGLPYVDMVLSGMSDMRQLEENVACANQIGSIPPEERQALIKRSASLHSFTDLYCTDCNYCNVCPHEIKIGSIFQLYLQHQIWGLSDSVRARRKDVKKLPSACTECGDCSARCPQKIDIPTEMKRVWPVIQGL